MARWKLASPHYLFTVRPEEWEYVEDGRRGGPRRHRFSIPRLLHPDDSKSWTKTWGPSNDLEGEIIVCIPGRGEHSDIEFIGDPTPEMIPVDDEAKAISARFEKHWGYKPDAEPGMYTQSLITDLQNKIIDKQSAPATVEIAGLSDLITAISAQAAALNSLIRPAA